MQRRLPASLQGLVAPAGALAGHRRERTTWYTPNLCIKDGINTIFGAGAKLKSTLAGYLVSKVRACSDLAHLTQI